MKIEDIEGLVNMIEGGNTEDVNLAEGILKTINKDEFEDPVYIDYLLDLIRISRYYESKNKS
jgi:hypothetical protein